MNDALREAYASGELVAFVGTGLSEAAGLPSRRGLVERLLSVARDYGLYPTQLEEIEELLASNELPAALSELEAALSKAAFTRAVRRALDDAGREPPPLARSLAELDGLRGVVTTNLDRLLERAFAGRWPVHARPLPNLAQGRGWIYKLHGTLGERETWVLTRGELERARDGDPAHRRLSEALFLGAPLLFVGCGLADPSFLSIVDRIAELVGDQTPQHFALVEVEGLRERHRRRLAAAGIEAVPTQGVEQVLESLPALSDSTRS